MPRRNQRWRDGITAEVLPVIALVALGALEDHHQAKRHRYADHADGKCSYCVIGGHPDRQRAY
jgi:hypothetical protein